MLLMVVGSFNLIGQVPRFEKFPVGNTGCTVYTPGDPNFELAYSEDSSLVYTGEVATDSFNYFVICVAFAQPMSDLPSERETLLTNYLNYLQQSFGITESAGYGLGHTMEGHPDAQGMIDFWVDGDGDQWQIKGWIDKNHLAVLGIYGSGTYPYFNAAQLFLNGFRFPGQ
jgi:hypothetical protein